MTGDSQTAGRTCPVCERENGALVEDRAVGFGPGPDTFLMCRPCQRVSDIVEAAPLTAYMPGSRESLAEWMRRLQDELSIKPVAS